MNFYVFYWPKGGKLIVFIFYAIHKHIFFAKEGIIELQCFKLRFVIIFTLCYNTTYFF